MESIAEHQSPTLLSAHPGRGIVRDASGRAWIALSALWAGFLALFPHLLHHAGPLAGAAILGGVTGSLLFGVLGLAASVPFVLRLHSRSGGWRMPAAFLATFAVGFSLSAFIIAPAINGDDGGSGPATGGAANAPAEVGHAAHH